MQSEPENLLPFPMPKKTFTPPNIDDCIRYAKSIGMSGEEAMGFHDYQLSIGWMVGKHPMKDWQAAMRTWHRNSIKWQKPATASQPQNSTARRIFLENRRKALLGAIEALRAKGSYEQDRTPQWKADMKANKEMLAKVEQELNSLI